MLQALQKGEEVVTTGGLVGRITKTTDQFLTIELADGVEVLVQRGAITQRLEKRHHQKQQISNPDERQQDCRLSYRL